MTPPSWYADPVDPALLRWWDGARWTDHVAPAPVPVAAPVADVATGIEAYLGRSGDTVVVSSRDVTAGLAPERCVPHGRRGGTAKVTFTSRTPAWVYLTVVVGLIVPVLIAMLVRRSVSAPTWPVCDDCRGERRRRMTVVWVALGSWIPLVGIALAATSALPAGAAMLLMVVAVLAPAVVAVWAADRASYARPVGGCVSQDGLTVTFPARVFPPEPAASNPATHLAGSTVVPRF